MKLTLKKDENGVPVFVEDKPMYVTEDGKDFVADVPSLYNKTLEMKGESKRFRERAEMAEVQVTEFRSLFPELDVPGVKEWKTKADAALVTVQNLSDKQLVDAGRVEEIKKELQDAHTKNLDKVNEQYRMKLSSLENTNKKKDQRIFQLVVGSRFSRSPWFSGESPKTTMLPDAAESLFGRHFEVKEDPTTGDLVVVGMFNGKEIFSTLPEKVGEIADFDEAIEYILDRYPHKSRILRSGSSGSGASGGHGGVGDPENDLSKLRARYKAAQEKNDARAMVVLKRQLHEAAKKSNR